jgi:heparan-alpha-glucosaminide N-acetyltransferase
MYNPLTTQRIRSIDAFRGITILVMIFVNDVVGVSGIPGWMKHEVADADAMTFVDVVFPAFLFIVGMSLPFAITSRLEKGESFWKIQGHILSRTIGLLILGIFMETEQEDDYNERAMGISLAAWSLLFYLCVILVWNVYRFKNKIWSYALRALGAIGLILLAFDYRGGGGANGSHGLIPHSWGILGLIGWAYLFSCIIYQLVKGRFFLSLIAIAVCIAWYAVSRSGMAKSSMILHWMSGKAGHAVHTSIVLFGIVLSLLFFDEKNKLKIKSRFACAGLLSLAAFITGYLLRPYYAISKIYATPTWALYSVSACILIYSFLYWLIDIKKLEKWTWFFQPAASNSLLVYILPGIIMFLQIEFNLYFMPAKFHEGLLGVIWSACFAVLVMWLAMGLNKLKIRLHL